MALISLRLRRAFSASYPLLRHSVHQPQPITSITSHLLSAPTSNPNPSPSAAAASVPSSARSFTSTSALFARRFDPTTDDIGPDTILFEGCDYNHWLITVDFPKDSDLTRDQMIETYVNTAAQVFGSVEEAKKNIYAVSTTVYEGFQVVCSEEISEKFKSLPGVVFVLPDSYIDPVNKEYGGDKYVNGEIFPRPPPVHYGRRDNTRDNTGRRTREYFGSPRQQNYGPPQQQNHEPPPQQNYGPPPRQTYGPPPEKSYGPQPQPNYGPPPLQNYGPPPQQNYRPPSQQNYGPPPQQNYGPPPQQNYGPPPQQNYEPPPQQNYGPPPQQNYGPPPQQNYRPPPQQNYGPPPQQNHGPPPQQSYGNSPNSSAQQNYGLPPEQRGFSQGTTYGSSQGGGFDQVPGALRNFSSTGNN